MFPLIGLTYLLKMVVLYSGELNNSESSQYYIEVDTQNLIEGIYDALITISSIGNSNVDIPISLNVTSNLSQLGDVNGD